MLEVSLHRVAWLVVPAFTRITAGSAGGGGRTSEGAGASAPESHDRIDTTIDCFTPVPPPK